MQCLQFLKIAGVPKRGWLCICSQQIEETRYITSIHYLERKLYRVRLISSLRLVFFLLFIYFFPLFSQIPLLTFNNQVDKYRKQYYQSSFRIQSLKRVLCSFLWSRRPLLKVLTHDNELILNTLGLISQELGSI